MQCRLGIAKKKNSRVSIFLRSPVFQSLHYKVKHYKIQIKNPSSSSLTQLLIPSLTFCGFVGMDATAQRVCCILCLYQHPCITSASDKAGRECQPVQNVLSTVDAGASKKYVSDGVANPGAHCFAGAICILIRKLQCIMKN